MPSGHVDRDAPLKPLSAHAWEVLEQLNEGPIAGYQINPGVRDRLVREGLAKEMPRRGDWVITEAGKAKLNDELPMILAVAIKAKMENAARLFNEAVREAVESGFIPQWEVLNLSTVRGERKIIDQISVMVQAK
jgi:hypothetical protein